MVLVFKVKHRRFYYILTSNKYFNLRYFVLLGMDSRPPRICIDSELWLSARYIFSILNNKISVQVALRTIDLNCIHNTHDKAQEYDPHRRTFLTI